MTVGDNIKRIRKEKGLSQKRLADRLGTSQQNLAQYENNKRKPKPATLQKIASALEVAPYELEGNHSPICDINVKVLIATEEKKNELILEIIRYMGYVIEFSGCPGRANLWQYDEDKNGFWNGDKFITSCQFGTKCETCQRKDITFYEISKNGKSVKIENSTMHGFFAMIELEIKKLLSSIFEYGNI